MPKHRSDMPQHLPQQKQSSGDETVSWLTAVGFVLIGIATTVVQSLVTTTLFFLYYLYIVIVLVGWVPFVVLGAITLVAGWKIAKLRWYGVGLIIGALAVYWPLIIEVYVAS